jgi:hypothetical protein
MTVVVLLTRALAYCARLIAPPGDRFREEVMLIELGDEEYFEHSEALCCNTIRVPRCPNEKLLYFVHGLSACNAELRAFWSAQLDIGMVVQFLCSHNLPNPSASNLVCVDSRLSLVVLVASHVSVHRFPDVILEVVEIARADKTLLTRVIPQACL